MFCMITVLNFFFFFFLHVISENRPCSENHRVHVQQVGDTLHINLELISNDLQKELTDQLGPFLKLEPDSEVFSSVTFNYLTEDVYRNSLQRQFRKLGYDCVFARYNGARGLASFNKIEPEDVQVKRSYYRSGLPNNCWW